MTETLQTPALIGVAEGRIAAVDNGGTNTRVSLMEGDVQIGYAEYKTPTDYERAIDKVEYVTSVLMDGRSIDAIGFAVAGQVEGGRIVEAGELKKNGWCGKPFQEDIAAQLGISVERATLLNDCSAATFSQMVENRRQFGPHSGFTETISTGYGGAGFEDDQILPYEPGHIFLRHGAVCGCGREGCAESHMSGSGIERKYGLRAENLPPEKWREVVADMVDAHVNLINTFETDGFRPEVIYLFGSVALKGRGATGEGVVHDLRAGLNDRMDVLPFHPLVEVATNGDDSGIKGAEYAARELLAA